MNSVGEFLKDVWRLARPYFVGSEERWSARMLLVSVIGLSLASVWLSVLLNSWHREFYNAVQEKNWHAFIDLLLFYRRDARGLTMGFTVLAFSLVAMSIIQVYLTQWLQIRWRRWMTERLLNEWLADRAYYAISLRGETHEEGTDNPDQRISEDIRDYTNTTLSLTLGLISNVVTLFSFFMILWRLSDTVVVFGVSVPGDLVWIALIYSVGGTIFTHLIGRPLAALNFRQQRVEADFRYAMVRVRENVEGIALHRGEAYETTSGLRRFMEVVANFRAIMYRTLLLNFVTVGYGQTAVIVPFVAAAPRYFAGKVQMGVLFQTAGAFGQVQGALSWVVNSYSDLANWRSVVERLSTFHRAIDEVRAPNARLVRAPSTDGAVRLKGVDLALPDGTPLLEGADLTLSPSHSVVISGRSGSGKSTLFRAIAGIWPFTHGEFQVPKNMFFLPQRPYIPLGTLADVIAYPHDASAYDASVLADALRDVGLGHLTDRLKHDENWPQSLSGGELQRVAVARALLAKPSWIFLDEATSSLDPEGEAALYRTLRRKLPDATLVSIAHRPAVAGFHEEHIVFRRDGGTPGTLVAAAEAT
jgi:vitamin B12/bleomycin/antimicrobial peptide transport system ATP-binding/permease protein